MRILTLFLSAGKSLRFWQREGLFSREILIYRELLKAGAFDRIQVFSYDADDRAALRELAATDPLYEKFDVIAPAQGRAGKAWALTGVLANRGRIAQSAALKTNQITGSAPAILAARLTGVPLVLRLGYVLSRRFSMNGQGLKAAVARAIEAAGARTAARIVVTSEAAAGHFRDSHAVGDKVRLLPTYVDTGAFAPAQVSSAEGDAIAVARFSPQKNLPALLRACALAGVPLTLVGKGEGEAELRSIAETSAVPVTFAGSIDNAALPDLLGRHGLFLLPSLHEGLPKVLIEAMAAGLTCIGSNIPGITDLIEDGVTGYLIDGFSPEDIAATIRRARERDDPEIGVRGRARIEAKFGLPVYLANEIAVFREVA
jgi:glycosyltransferase involved in cell wall biosynthesis